MSITTEDLGDLVNTTLTAFDYGKWTDLTGDIQEYHALPNILKKEKVKFKTGKNIGVNIATDSNGQARWVGFFETDNYNIRDVMSQGTAPWRHATWNYSYDRREEEINSGDKEQIVDLVKTRRGTSFIEGAKLLEAGFWGKPATSADVTTVWGVDMFIVRNATTGFNGGNPSGFTTGAIFDSTVQTRWKNHTAQFVNFTKSDAVRKMRQSATKTMFKSPVDQSEIRNGALKRAIYSGYSNIAAAEELAEAQNENLGNDLASRDGSAYFRKVPFIYAPQLDSDTQTPVYGIDWSTF